MNSSNKPSDDIQIRRGSFKRSPSFRKKIITRSIATSQGFYGSPQNEIPLMSRKHKNHPILGPIITNIGFEPFFTQHKDDEEINNYTERFCSTDGFEKPTTCFNPSYNRHMSISNFQSKTIDHTHRRLLEKRSTIDCTKASSLIKCASEKEIKKLVNACTEFGLTTKRSMRLYNRAEVDLKNMFKNIQSKVLGVLMNDEYLF
jgi:hypothetical protein